MDIKVIDGDITDVECDALVLPHWEGEEACEGALAAADKALDGAVSRLVVQGEIKGKKNEVTVIHSPPGLAAARVAVVGLGKRDEADVDGVREAAAVALRVLRGKGVRSVASAALGIGLDDITAASSAQAMAEGALLGLYTFRRHITKEAEHGDIDVLTIVADAAGDISLMEEAVRRGVVLAEAANLARDMANEPGNFMTPVDMARVAAEVARDCGLEITVIEREKIEEMGMGALLGVAQGSREAPKLIVLRYDGGGGGGVKLALVGKGVTFDSGGISIKPSNKMEEMKTDMAGGASVIAAMGAIARLGLKINVLGVVPAVENLPGGAAFKPGDVLTAMSGKTIEIITTDAEGRLILADALGYAVKEGAESVIDVATLTGACCVALGDTVTGVFTNDDALAERIAAAGKTAGERMWRMPMPPEYEEQLKSDVADLKNVGGRWGGAITAAQFLAEFVGDTPWAHLDIAGPSLAAKARGFVVKGATGVPVRTLVNLVISASD